jgi:hypothetical protein
MKKNAHPYGRWVQLIDVQDPLLRHARKKTRPLPLPIYETEAIVSKHVDTAIQTNESYRAADSDDGSSFVGDYVMPEDEKLHDLAKLISGG